jgi:hypothetical protein
VILGLAEERKGVIHIRAKIGSQQMFREKKKKKRPRPMSWLFYSKPDTPS